jgi:activator of HSP90 ATPase
MKTKTIKQTVTFSASPKAVYELIMDAKKHSAVVGGKVKMSNKEKGTFEVYDGYCRGYNIELKEGKKIVQGWYFKEEGWPEDHFSICTFTFNKVGKGTKMTFTQSGIPERNSEGLKKGWKEFYWEPMKIYLGNN